MSNIADRVRELISASQLSEEAFAAQADLDSAALAAALSGQRPFSSLDLAKIADAREENLDYLITGVRPRLDSSARAERGDARTALTAALRYTAHRQSIAEIGYGLRWRRLDVPVDLSGWRQWGRAAAQRARQVFVADPDLVAAVEESFGVDIALVDLGGDFDGMAASADDTKIIILGTSSNPCRQRFTLAHELGHLLAGDDQEISLDKNIFLQGRQWRSDSEQRANAFAAVFLMPEDLLRARVGSMGLTDQGFAELVTELWVSPKALAIRLKELHLIDSGRCDRFSELSALRAAEQTGKTETYEAMVAEAQRPRPPRLLVRDTMAVYEAGRSTLQPLASLLDEDVGELERRLEPGY
ncbi:ImmA/IrrE family metallo-endopeptidase [Nonomuraea sp. NPDC052129]|uniref:ImmA/IrrE family metallo-endopeptidase n=1 Tax=Nonomuraea sp. NPDC052129 TaxID=3154651 RepID=UPI003440FA81